MGIAVLLVGLYVFFAYLGLSFASFHQSISPVWPPSGFAFTILFLLGIRCWPIVWIGAFLANDFLSPVGWGMASCIAVGNTLEACLGAWALQRFQEKGKPLESVGGFALFVLAVGLSTAVGASVGVVSLCLGEMAKWENFEQLWYSWWLGDATGNIIFAPLILFMKDFLSSQQLRTKNLWEIALLIIATVFISAVVFWGNSNFYLLSPYLLLPCFFWASVRFEQAGVAVVSLLVTVLAVLATVRGYGPFAHALMNESLLSLQLFIGLLTLTAHFVASVFGERKSILQKLQVETAMKEAAHHRADEANARVRATIENAMDCIITINEEGFILDWNPVAEKTTGWNKEEVLGRKLSEILIPSPQRELYEKGLKRYQLSGQSVVLNRRTEMQALHRLGHQFPVEITITPICFGRKKAITAFMRDITERKASEKSLRKNASDLEKLNSDLEQFVSIASHDLKAPVRSLTQYAQLMEEEFGDKIGETGREHLKTIIHKGKQMGKLLDDLLEYSRQGWPQTERQEINLTEILDECIHSDLSSVISEKNARVVYEPLPVLMANKTQIWLLFNNLLSNALKYCSPERPPEITVSYREDETDWIFEIKDNGIGIDLALQKKIFEPFVRGSGVGDYPGTGLGLSTCKKIIANLGGRIWFTSEKGFGSSFFFSIPRNAHPFPEKQSNPAGSEFPLH